VFRGEVRQAPGCLGDVDACAEPILFVADLSAIGEPWTRVSLGVVECFFKRKKMIENNLMRTFL